MQLIDDVSARAVAELTERQRQVLVLMSKGFSNKQIAGFISLASTTVNDYTKDIYRKLCVSGRVEAAVIAVKAGLPI